MPTFSNLMVKLMLIGTAHVLDLGAPIDRYIREFEPNAVALELDRERWFSLNSKRKYSEGPIFLRSLARLQEYLGNYFGSSPGSEMLAAAKVANIIGADINLIDKPIIPILKEAWKKMPWSEFWHLIGDSMISFVGGGKFDFEKSMKTGDFTEELLEFSRIYPSIKKELIDGRDEYMSFNLIKLFRTKKYDKIVAVVGEGHIDGISFRLSSLNPKVIRLSDLLKSEGSNMSFSIEI